MQQNGEEPQENTRLPLPVEPEEQEGESGISEQQEQLFEAERKAQEYLNLLQRTQADFMNYRHRMSQRQEELRLTAQGELLNQLLPALDDFAKALETMPEEQASNPWEQGLSLVARRFLKALDQAGVHMLGTPGETFDPRLHDAIEKEVHPDVPEGTILQVFRPGYALKARVIRPAQVIVATSPTLASSAPGKADDH